MKHLGGHLNITHTDRGVIEFLKTEFNSESLLDIGCGPAGQVKVAKDIGFNIAIGIDGDPAMKRDGIIIHDFCSGSYEFNREFDLGWSCEFVEHVEEQYIDNFMACFVKCKIVALTHATPGTPGHHHVNCQNASYWEGVFKKYGFTLDKLLTQKCKNQSTMRRDFFRKNGLVFKRI